MVEPTPGEWVYEAHFDDSCFGVYLAFDDGMPDYRVQLATTLYGTEEDEANARLFAGAKKLLAYAECQQAIDEYDRDGGILTQPELLAVLRCHGWEHDDTLGCRQWARDLRRSALAKATGQPTPEPTR